MGDGDMEHQDADPRIEGRVEEVGDGGVRIA